MKTIYRLFSLFALLLLAVVPVRTAHAQGLGVTAGLNFNDLGDIDTGDRQATLDNATGWHVGVWFDLPLGLLAVRPGIRYMDAGNLFETKEVLGQNIPDINADVNLIEIPIDVRFRFGPPLVTPFVMAGPVLRFPSGGNDEDRFESFSYAGSLGAGIELSLVGIRLIPELKYTFGLSRFAKDFELVGREFSPDNDGRLNTIMLSLGVGL